MGKQNVKGRGRGMMERAMGKGGRERRRKR
jgi:hypothetical protein